MDADTADAQFYARADMSGSPSSSGASAACRSACPRASGRALIRSSTSARAKPHASSHRRSWSRLRGYKSTTCSMRPAALPGRSCTLRDGVRLRRCARGQERGRESASGHPRARGRLGAGAQPDNPERQRLRFLPEPLARARVVFIPRTLRRCGFARATRARLTEGRTPPASVAGLGLLFGAVYFVQSVGDPASGLIAQPVRSLLADWARAPPRSQRSWP